jgi:2'-5' RNA ligase
LAKEAAARVKAVPFEVSLARAESFRNRTGVFPFVLTGDAAPWKAFHDALGASLREIGLGGATKGEFKPHMTLTYDEIRVKAMAVEPFTWTVRDFVLVHSRLGRTAHDHLGRWALS